MRHINLRIKPAERPKLCFSETAYIKMLQIIMTSSNEIAWHGAVVRDAVNPLAFHVEDIYLFPQICTASTVLVDEAEYAAWFATLAKDRERIMKHRLHGHSHVNMPTFPSRVDREYRDSLTCHYKTKGENFYIFLILNKSNDWDIEIHDMYSMCAYDTNDVDVYVADMMLSGFNAEIKTAVTSKSVPMPHMSAKSNSKQKPLCSESVREEPVYSHILCDGCALEEEEDLCWEQMQRTPPGVSCYEKFCSCGL